MAALSSRLASMGFMKRAAAMNAGQPAAEPAEPSQQQQQQQQHRHSHKRGHPAVEHVQDRQPERTGAAPAASGQDIQQAQRHQPSSNNQQDSSSQPKKLALSSNLASMAFMQRAKHKRRYDEAIGQDEAAKEAAEWVSAVAVKHKGCVIVHERDPLPSGVNGRIAFGYGPIFEAAAAEAAAREEAAAAAAAAGGADIQDEEMTERWTKGWQDCLRTKKVAKRMKRQHQDN